MTVAYRLGVLGVLLVTACGGDNSNKTTAMPMGGNGNTSGNGNNGSMAGKTSGGQTSMGGSSSGSGGDTMAMAGLPSLTEAGAPTTGVSKGKVGVWEDITPKGISLDPQNPGGGDNFGIQDVLVDPARPTDVYAFVCYQGLWRSQDYGDTWQQVNPGKDTNGQEWGKPWGTAISPQADRMNTKSPVLTAGPSNPTGFLKSLDFGVTWTATKLPDAFGDFRYQQVYSIDFDPYDVNHIIVAFHEAPDVGESTDGGKTWIKHETPAGEGTSYYPFFINTGDKETTRKTWITFPQENGTGKGLRTDDGGKTWKPLNMFQHHHGSAQLYDAGGGTVYVASMNPVGIYKSTDYGVTWDQLTDKSQGVVTGGKKHLYASVGVGYIKAGDPYDPKLITAPIGDDKNWTEMERPPGMFDGAKRIAVTYDNEHEIVISGNWHAGIWRYIQP